MKIAVVGSGISGLSSAYRLTQAGHEVSLFEANDYFGGHTHTVDVSLNGLTHGVDTGFLVFNHQTYPNLVKLFAELDVETTATDMSFSVKIPLGKGDKRTLEWAGANLDTVFAQRRNLFSPRFLNMLRDIVRFNSDASAMALANANDATDNTSDAMMSLGEYLHAKRYSRQFRDWYLLPMAGCIWSCPTEQMLAFPALSFVRFCHNHGLLQVNNRPQWRTVKGGARNYVEKMLQVIRHKHLKTAVQSVSRVKLHDAPKIIVVAGGVTSVHDHVVLAGHSNQTLKILKDASSEERSLLGAIKYQPNRALLHTDSSMLPANKKAWSAWNYQSENGQEPNVCVHYLLNQLQPLPFTSPVIVSLNPIDEPRAGSLIAEYDYEHPVFDGMAIAAQGKLASIQGKANTWFAGAWTGYGFHEDGLKSGLAVAEGIAGSGANAAAQPARHALAAAA